MEDDGLVRIALSSQNSKINFPLKRLSLFAGFRVLCPDKIDITGLRTNGRVLLATGLEKVYKFA